MYAVVSQPGNLYNSVDIGLRRMTDPLWPEFKRGLCFCRDIIAMGGFFAAVFVGLMAA